MSIRSRAELVDYFNHGNKVKYVFFWGHQKPSVGVSKTCFSQWYESHFIVEKQKYPTAEHYMMAEKAKLFNDVHALERILAAGNPGDAKKHGRNVIGFDEAIWLSKRFEIVVKANLEKFSQNNELKEFLVNTGKRVLVEASPIDKVWGIGQATDNQAIENPNKWKGLNLLGFALMEVRDQLSTSKSK